MVFDIDYSWFKLHYFKMGLDNAVEELNISLNTDANADYDLIDKEFSLFTVSKHFIFVVGAVPVVVEVNIDLKGEISATVNAAMNFGYEYNRKNYFTANIEYSDKDWKRNFLNPPPVVNKQFNFSIIGNATQRFSIGPEVSFKLYKIVGPYVGLTLNQQAEIYASQNLDWNAGLELGGELKIGAKAEILKKTLFDTYYSWEQGICSYRFPYSMEIVSGNNQTYTPGQALTHKTKIQINSNKGVQLPFGRVVFEPQNGGTVSSGVVLADQYGFAETSWTPGGAENSQLKVSVLDGRGNHILNSPLTFNASTTESNCSQSTLAVGINKTDNTIHPQAYLGEPPYTYSTDGVSYQSTVPAVTVSPGTDYTFYVKDASQCIVSKSYNSGAEVTPSLTLSVVASGKTIEAQAQGGKPPYEYSLDNSISGFTTNSVFENVSNGQHTVYAKDANDTLVSKEVTVNYQSENSGTFTDSRDGNTYKWVEIGDQVWMAENLAYDAGGDCWAYDNDESNVATYGRLYTWEVALEACPSGWHLPSDGEWEQLAQYVSDQKGPYSKSDDEWSSEWHDVDKHLKTTSGWNSNGNGTDDFGFAALPGGYRRGSLNFNNIGDLGIWWSSTEYNIDSAWDRFLSDNNSTFGSFYYRGDGNKYLGLSVRCVRD